MRGDFCSRQMATHSSFVVHYLGHGIHVYET